MTTPSTHQTLVQYCYQHLKEKIICGELAPGEKLQIAKLKSLLKVGPTPIREALSRLTSSGLIDVEDHKGFRVKTISEAEIRDIYATFSKIEILALQQAMELGDTNWEANVMASLYKLSVIEKSPPPIDSRTWLQRNYEFHYALIVACQSPCLLKIREDLYQLFDRYCHLSFLINEHSLQANHQDHGEIAKAVLHREKDKACQLMTSHLKNSLEQVLERLKHNSFLTHLTHKEWHLD